MPICEYAWKRIINSNTRLHCDYIESLLKKTADIFLFFFILNLICDITAPVSVY